jgi:hypothetical protein
MVLCFTQVHCDTKVRNARTVGEYKVPRTASAICWLAIYGGNGDYCQIADFYCLTHSSKYAA